MPTTTRSVTSKDGIAIGYLQFGRGPGVILVHGGMKSSHDFVELARALSETFTVYIPDRRGRGASGSHGADYCIMREVEDMQALIAKTESHAMFGLSAGGLVALRTALATPSLTKLSLYEPPLSVGGSVPTSWLPRYEDEITQGKLASAVVTAMKGLGTEPLFRNMPRWLLRPLMALIMQVQGRRSPVSIRTLIRTLHFDMCIVREMSNTLSAYRSLDIQTQLLGGGKSPQYLAEALDNLVSTLPHTKRMTFQALGHDGPENDGQPVLVAEALRKFLRGEVEPNQSLQRTPLTGRR